ncbi:MAG: HD-GYP domain-containing protein [Lacipirellulaceae bacterium]
MSTSPHVMPLPDRFVPLAVGPVDRLIAPAVERFAARWGGALASPVTVWRKVIDAPLWVELGPITPDASVDVRLVALEALIADASVGGPSVIRQAWIDEARKLGEPVVRPLTDGWRAVVTSIQDGGDVYAFSAVCPEADDRALGRLAAAAQGEWQRSELVNELERENDSFAAQLASDLEELSFLRSMVDRLGDVPADGELQGMTARTLPVLNETVRAECLAYVKAESEKADADRGRPASRVAFRLGPSDLPNATIAAIAELYGARSAQTPLVRNWSGDDITSASEPAIEGVRSIAMAPLSSGAKLLGWIVAVNRQAPSVPLPETPWQLASDEFGSGEATLLATTASVLAMHAANLEMLREKEQIMVSVVRSLVSAIEAKDPYTCGHSERVALFARRLAQELDYTEEASERLYLASLLHDVGKIGVADAVLKKEGKLTDEEHREISKHPDEGWAILCDLQQLRYVLPGVLHHHERWDGRGYPDKLAGVAIPLDGRVLAVADAYDAMTSDRPYRMGMPSEKAEAILREGAGAQWDPTCVEAFFACREDLHRIQSEYTQRERPKRSPQSVPVELVRRSGEF